MGIDVTNWNEEAYRRGILQERESQYRTIFRTIFAPPQFPNSTNPNPDIVVAASSDGSVASYSISSCLSLQASVRGGFAAQQLMAPEPNCFIRAHDGPAYDVKFYEDGENTLLMSCGDDGRVRGWKWNQMVLPGENMDPKSSSVEPVIELTNPQQKGPWGALSPIPESNAIAVDKYGKSIYVAAGDSCAYCWDLETSKIKNIYRGHSDYLHCIATRQSGDQIITGSEDGTGRLWDCRSGKCIFVISPQNDKRLKGMSSISCVSLDSNENWLVFGSGQNLYVWNLLAREEISRISTLTNIQDVVFANNEILAVGAGPLLSRFELNGAKLSQIQCAPQSAFSVSLHPTGVVAVAGYGGLVDLISQFGSHLCTFRGTSA